MIGRATYLEQLKAFIDKPLIKVLTGIRRSGKSAILLLLKETLLEQGVEPEQIVFINLESFNFAELRTAAKLYQYTIEKAPAGKKVYLLLDEIQEVAEWERAVNSLMVDLDADIYLTGSNSHLLSSELATYLAGRYVEIPVYTLSFAEYLDFRRHYTSTQASFLSYLRLGGFPVLHIADYQEESAYKVVYDIYSSVILRDTIQRYNIRDIELLERVMMSILRC